MRFLADENVDLDLVRAIRRSRADLDLITSGEAGLLGALDPAVLDAAAALDRVPWTHDIRTMPAHVRDRVEAESGELPETS